jgi:hypothetical protein
VEQVRPAATVQDVEALEIFMYYQAKALQGIFGEDASLWSVRRLWNSFTGAWRREHGPIADDIVESITNVRSKFLWEYQSTLLTYCFF